MKKFLTMAVAALAVSSQAASIAWGSGKLTQPIDGSGTFGATNIGGSAGYMTVWFFASEADANSFVSSGYTAGNFVGSTLAGTEGQTKDSVAGLGAYSGTTADAFAVDTQYFTVAYVETTITGNANPVLNNTWYMYTGVGSVTTQATGNTTINFLTGAGIDGAREWPSNWTPVPEPATGALALAGAALLLRRRRRA